MASIYEIDNYDTGGNDYVKDDIVAGTAANDGTTLGRFYYNLGVPPTNAKAPEATGGDEYWGGYATFDSVVTPHFFWIPSYAPSVTNEPKIKSVQFGDGYEQRTPYHINANLLSLSLNFDKRNEKEATAIAHFLAQRKGSQAFVFLPPAPYASMKKFVCKKWDVSMQFENSFGISATFGEVVE